MLGKIPSYLPKKDISPYRILSAFLYLFFLVGLVYGALTFLFPYQRYTFDFNNPDATKNNLFEPHREDFSFPTDGKVAADESVTAYANNPQILESGDVRIVPREDEAASFLAGTQVVIKKGWAATFFPTGDEADIPKRTIVEYQGSFYEWREDTLYPFVSQAAALSYVPASQITPLAESIFPRLIKSEELLGFRPGTLLAYADGVFFVSEEGTIRPFGSAEVLLRSGYSFDHVITASGEDVGIYTRGKIILPGELHLGGTLFQDTDTKKMYLFQDKKMLPLTQMYADFLASQNDVILFSSAANIQEASCVLEKEILRKSYGCRFDLLALHGPGNDYQVAVTDISEDTDIQTFSVGLQSSREPENAAATFRSLMTRILERLGLY